MSKTNLQLLTEKEAAKLLGMTPRFLQARRVRGNGPPFIRISSRAIRYRVSDLESWVRDRLRTSTAED
jgi:predicted DNA-binding transcriptional regulator AlpA